MKEEERAERYLGGDPAGALRARDVDAAEHPERIAV
jgi:hypothetical protein